VLNEQVGPAVARVELSEQAEPAVVGAEPVVVHHDPVVIGTVPTEKAEVARRMALSLGIQLATKVVHLVLNVVSSLAVIRYLVPATYGNYVLIVALLALFGMLADFGITKLGVREVSADETAEAAVIGTIIALRLGLSALAGVGIQLALWALGRGAEIRWAAAIASLSLLSTSVLSIAIALEVRLRQYVETSVIVVGELVETSLILTFVILRRPITDLFAATATGTAVAAALAGVIVVGRLGVRPRFEARRVRPLARAAVPLAAVGLVGVTLVKLDSIMLASLRSSTAVGLYGAAYQPVEYLLIGAVAFASTMLPLLTRFARTDRVRFGQWYHRGSEAVLAVMVPVGLLVVAVAGPVVRLAFSARYGHAVPLLRLLGVSAVLMTFSAWEGIVLLALGRERLTVRYNLMALGLGLIVHGCLIAWLGAPGAALGSITIGLFTSVAGAVAVYRVAHLGLDVGRAARLLAACGVAASAFALLRLAGLTVVPDAVVAVAVYLVAVLATGLVDPRSVRTLLAQRPSVITPRGLS
jgi:O-antigen/teichoic acid export membrane protein